MEIKTTTKYGGAAESEKTAGRDGFILDLTANVSEAQVQELAKIGLASLAYRAGAAVLNKALGVKSNSEAEYSEPAASKIAVALGEWANAGKIDGITGGFDLDVAVSRREIGKGATPKFAREKSILKEKLDGGRALADIAEKIGFKGDTGEAPDFTEEFLRAVKAALDAAAKAAV